LELLGELVLSAHNTHGCGGNGIYGCHLKKTFVVVIESVKIGEDGVFPPDSGQSAVDGSWGEVVGSHRCKVEAGTLPKPGMFSTAAVNGPA
jgi:hypothetical protein